MQAATTWNSSEVVKVPRFTRFMPCAADLAFLLPACLLFTKLSGTQLLFTDGDTGWHIRTGEWILDHRTIPTVDLFSYTKPGQPWFAWEWGWDVLFALIHRASGLAGVGFVTVVLLCVAALLSYRLVLKACGNFVLSFALTGLVVCGSVIHWLARPHLFSWIFLLTFLHALPAIERGERNALWLAPALMLLWVNIHGGFFVGIVLLLTFAIGRSTEDFFVKGLSWHETWRLRRPLWLSAAACFAVTFLNPSGWHLHEHIVRYLGDATLMDNIQEFQSVSFHSGPSHFFEAMLVLALGAAFWHLQRGEVTPALLIGSWAHLAMFSARNIPLFLMIAAPLVAVWVKEMLRTLKPIRLIGGALTTVSEICQELKPLELAPRTPVLPGLAILGMATLFASGAKGFEGQFNPDAFPLQAAPFIEHAQGKRIFTYDQWADYLIYRFYPTQRVFIDGRSDFFGDELVTTTQRLIAGRFDWEATLQRFSVDMVLMKPDAPLAGLLKMSSGWNLLFDDGKVLIFERRASLAPSGKQDLTSSHLLKGETKK